MNFCAIKLHFITELIKVVKKNGYAGEPKRRGRKPKKLAEAEKAAE